MHRTGSQAVKPGHWQPACYPSPCKTHMPMGSHASRNPSMARSAATVTIINKNDNKSNSNFTDNHNNNNSQVRYGNDDESSSEWLIINLLMI